MTHPSASRRRAPREDRAGQPRHQRLRHHQRLLPGRRGREGRRPDHRCRHRRHRQRRATARTPPATPPTGQIRQNEANVLVVALGKVLYAIVPAAQAQDAANVDISSPEIRAITASMTARFGAAAQVLRLRRARPDAGPASSQIRDASVRVTARPRPAQPAGHRRQQGSRTAVHRDRKGQWASRNGQVICARPSRGDGWSVARRPGGTTRTRRGVGSEVASFNPRYLVMIRMGITSLRDRQTSCPNGRAASSRDLSGFRASCGVLMRDHLATRDQASSCSQRGKPVQHDRPYPQRGTG